MTTESIESMLGGIGDAPLTEADLLEMEEWAAEMASADGTVHDSRCWQRHFDCMDLALIREVRRVKQPSMDQAATPGRPPWSPEARKFNALAMEANHPGAGIVIGLLSHILAMGVLGTDWIEGLALMSEAIKTATPEELDQNRHPFLFL